MPYLLDLVIVERLSHLHLSDVPRCQTVMTPKLAILMEVCEGWVSQHIRGRPWKDKSQQETPFPCTWMG